jgi:hypothetical protein
MRSRDHGETQERLKRILESEDEELIGLMNDAIGELYDCLRQRRELPNDFRERHYLKLQVLVAKRSLRHS